MTTLPARNALLALLAGSSLLAACASDPTKGPQPTNPLALTPTEQYAVELAPGSDEIFLAPHGVLSPNQAAALGELVMRWRESGEAGIDVEAPDAGPARDTALAAVELLKGYGASASVLLAPAAPDAPPVPVRVSYARMDAVIPHCADRWGELTRTKNNQPYAAFGCAVTANLAAQTANAGDLVRPRAGTPADGERRADVVEKYRKGQPTATQRSADERGVVSNAVQ